MNSVKLEIKDLGMRMLVLMKWILYSTIVGFIVGLVGVAVVKLINCATDFRTQNFWHIFLLPFVGLFFVFIYKMSGRENDSGTNTVLSAIKQQKPVQMRSPRLILIATIFTNFAGGSSGREGAALQFGGSLGATLGHTFKFSDKDKTIMIMCGMSAAFSAVFGLPLCAIIFPMEVVAIGIMHYSALVPCTVASLVAHWVALFLGCGPDKYDYVGIGQISVKGVALIVALAVLSAVVSIIFCFSLHRVQKLVEKYIPCQYLRVIVGGCAIIALTLLFGTDYDGLGTDGTARAINEGECHPLAFILKIVFTLLTLCFGYKGGEIIPAFFVGATFGCLFGNLCGFSPMLCAAIGMVCVFCGVTNCPLSSLFIAVELFGFTDVEYFIIAVGIAYVISGYFSLYSSQDIIYSKTEATFINKKAK